LSLAQSYIQLVKRAYCAQLILIPEGLNPFKIPLAPIHQSLAQFNSKSLTIKINGNEISLTNNNLPDSDGKDGKAGFIIPYDVDPLIYYMTNFEYMVLMILKSDSQARVRVGAAAEIIETDRMQIQMLCRSYSYLPAKILFYIHSRFQVFL